jgi:hypothetical protein
MTFGRKVVFGGVILMTASLTYCVLEQWTLRQTEPVRPRPAPQAAVRGTASQPVENAMPAGPQDMFHNDDLLAAYVKEHGLPETVAQLHQLSLRYGDCHQQAHKAGRIAYRVYSTDAFRAIASECHAGAFHGAVEAYFKEHGTARLSEDVKVICRSELNHFFSHQCMHGIGHGLMAAANYDLPRALEDCDPLGRFQASCWTGVFMENIVGGLGGHASHHEGHAVNATSYLNDDPHYPCTIVQEKYQSSCYFLQPSRMMQLFGPDFGRMAAICAEAPPQHRRVCFESMGREVGGMYRGQPAVAIQSCGNAPEGDLRIGCLIGAVQDAFWDPAGQDNALGFCRLLGAKTEKDACFEIVFMRAPQILPSRQDLERFCAKVEADYRKSCLKKRTVFS